MFREFGERLHYVSTCPVKIFSASNMDRYWYPFRLQHVGYASERIREECMEYILDSDIGDEDVTNEEVLDRAHELNATYVVPKDYLHDRERTTESVHEFMALYEDHPCAARPLIPLQPTTRKEGGEVVPNTDHVEHLPELPEVGAYMVGGVKDAPPGKQLKAVRKVREERPHAYLHGLGMGASPEIVQAVREEPRLMDSLDMKTAEECAKNGKTFGESLTQVPNLSPRGDDSSTHRGLDASNMLLKLNYVCGPLVDDEKAAMLANRMLSSF